MKRVTIKLADAPEERWKLPAPLVADAAALIDMYVQDAGGLDRLGSLLDNYAGGDTIPADYRAEMRAMATLVDRPYEAVLLGNVYYDVIKLIMGWDNPPPGFACSAYAVDTPSGPVHARNLDWWSHNKLLAETTVVFDFVRDSGVGYPSPPTPLPSREREVEGSRIAGIETPAGAESLPAEGQIASGFIADEGAATESLFVRDGRLAKGRSAMPFMGVGSFSVIGWPGYIGALSALAPGRFAITLNAVISDEPPAVGAIPVSLLIRRTCETASSYADAVRMLSETPLVSDCLILVSGVKHGEMAVIERTPTRAAVRGPYNGCVVVTNDFRMIDARMGRTELASTAGDRFDRLTWLLDRRDCATTDYLAAISDPWVKAEMTMQQMVMSAATGQLDVITR